MARRCHVSIKAANATFDRFVYWSPPFPLGNSDTFCQYAQMSPEVS